jgi:hypothetical protein
LRRSGRRKARRNRWTALALWVIAGAAGGGDLEAGMIALIAMQSYARLPAWEA